MYAKNTACRVILSNAPVWLSLVAKVAADGTLAWRRVDSYRPVGTPANSASSPTHYYSQGEYSAVGPDGYGPARRGAGAHCRAPTGSAASQGQRSRPSWRQAPIIAKTSDLGIAAA